MKRSYDIVYLTNTPSFYKINLCDRLGKEGVKVMLVFYGYGNEAVNTALSARSNYVFDYIFLNSGDSNKRSVIKTFRELYKLMSGIKARIVLFAGWLAPEYNLFSFLSPKKHNVVIVESGYESTSKGFKKWIKHLILGRMKAALPSGQPHNELLNRLGFKGKRFTTGSVGIFNKPERPLLPHKPEDSNCLRYLYVGRLIDCKNLKFLIEQFNKSGDHLTIVGSGELEAALKAFANPNIAFKGFIDNNELGDIYQSHDVFILPSKSETWGLVVEEAIYWGLPVIVSDRVGAAKDMVETLETGLIFRFDDHIDFADKLKLMSANYEHYASNVSKIDFDLRDINQIEAYKSLLS